MEALVTRIRGMWVVLAVAGLIVAAASPVSAAELEHTYLPPFQHADADFSEPCADPGCRGEVSASADAGGAVTADVELVAAGGGRGQAAIASVGLRHTLEAPAGEVAVDLRVHVEEAFASAFGLPGTAGHVSIGLEAFHRSSSWAFASTWQPIVTADAPMNEDERLDQDYLVSAKIGDGRSIPAGEIEITAYLIAEATTMPPHTPSTASDQWCSCIGAGQVEARASGTVESVTVREVR